MLTRVIFALDVEKDADVISWLHKQPNKSAAIRAAVRAQYERETEYTIADVMRRLDELQRSGIAVIGDAGGDGDEPIEAVLALGELGR